MVRRGMCVEKIKKPSILNNLTISKKMVLIFIGSVLIPLTIQNSFYYKETEKNIQSQMMQRLTNSLDEKTNKINGIISGTITLSHKYSNDEKLYKFLDSYYSNDISYLIEYQDSIKEGLLSDMAYSRYVRTICLYTDNPTISLWFRL